MVNDKNKFLSLYVDNLGSVTKTLKDMGKKWSDYRQWCEDDPQFKFKVETIKNEWIPEIRLDFAITANLELIRNGCKVSTIFFLKTQGREHGYAERETTVNSARVINITIAPTNGRDDE